MQAPEYATGKARRENRDALNARLQEFVSTRTSAEWIDVLNAAGVPCGPIYTIDQVFADPQVRHLGMEAPVEHPRLGAIKVVGQAVAMSRARFEARRPTPERGQHTDEVLRELGMDDAEIAGLRERHII